MAANSRPSGILSWVLTNQTPIVSAKIKITIEIKIWLSTQRLNVLRWVSSVPVYISAVTYLLVAFDNPELRKEKNIIIPPTRLYIP